MKFLLTVFSLLFFIPGYSQKRVVTVYDSLWFLTTKDFGEYYRVGVIDTINYQYRGEVRDFYMNGLVQMKGNFNANGKVDTFYFYYPNGQLKMKGPYQNNVRYGTWTSYYENGQVKDKIVYNDHFLAPIEHFDEEGNPRMVNGTGVWEVTYFNDFSLDIKTVKGSYKDTLRHGTWKYYTKRAIPGNSIKEKLECMEVYEEGRFIKGKYYWARSVQNLKSPVINILPESVKFKKTENWEYSKYASIEAYPYLKFLPSVDSSLFPVNKFAHFPDENGSLADYFKKKIRLSRTYIESQKERGIGTYILIDEEGKLEVVEDPGEESLLKSYPSNQVFYDQVHQALKEMPLWEPAIRNNRKVKNYFYLVVRIDNGELVVHLSSDNDKVAN